MSRKTIYIGKTYKDEKGNDFTVFSIEQGKPIFKSNGHIKNFSPRVAINERGDRKKITNLKPKTSDL